MLYNAHFFFFLVNEEQNVPSGAGALEFKWSMQLEKFLTLHIELQISGGKILLLLLECSSLKGSPVLGRMVKIKNKLQYKSNQNFPKFQKEWWVNLKLWIYFSPFQCLNSSFSLCLWSNIIELSLILQGLIIGMKMYSAHLAFNLLVT